MNTADLGYLSLRLPVDLLERVRKSAASNRRSMNSEAVVILEQALPAEEAKTATEAVTSIAAE